MNQSTRNVLCVNNGVIAQLKRGYSLDFVEGLSNCSAHSFALVGYQAGFIKNGMHHVYIYPLNNLILDDEQKARKRDLISKLECIIGKIYQYFNASANRTIKLKCWQNLLDLPELKFKRLFSIRWTAIRDSIKPIILNLTPSRYFKTNFILVLF